MKTSNIVFNGNIITITGDLLSMVESCRPEGMHLQTHFLRMLERVVETLTGEPAKPMRGLCTPETPCAVCRSLDKSTACTGSTGTECPMQGCAIIAPDGEVIEATSEFSLWSGWNGLEGDSIFTLFPSVTSDKLTSILRDCALSGEPIFLQPETKQGAGCECALHIEPILHGDDCRMVYKATAAPAK